MCVSRKINLYEKNIRISPALVSVVKVEKRKGGAKISTFLRFVPLRWYSFLHIHSVFFVFDCVFLSSSLPHTLCTQETSFHCRASGNYFLFRMKRMKSFIKKCFLLFFLLVILLLFAGFVQCKEGKNEEFHLEKVTFEWIPLLPARCRRSNDDGWRSNSFILNCLFALFWTCVFIIGMNS